MRTKQELFLYHLLMGGKKSKKSPKEMQKKIGGSMDSIYSLASNLENRGLIKKKYYKKKMEKPKRVIYQINEKKIDKIRRLVK